MFSCGAWQANQLFCFVFCVCFHLHLPRSFISPNKLPQPFVSWPGIPHTSVSVLVQFLVPWFRSVTSFCLFPSVHVHATMCVSLVWIRKHAHSTKTGLELSRGSWSGPGTWFWEPLLVLNGPLLSQQVLWPNASIRVPILLCGVWTISPLSPPHTHTHSRTSKQSICKLDKMSKHYEGTINTRTEYNLKRLMSRMGLSCSCQIGCVTGRTLLEMMTQY